MQVRAFRGLCALQAAAYEALKWKLADQFSDDRRSYTQGKTRFIEQVLARVLG